jgi:hypothetical protein
MIGCNSQIKMFLSENSQKRTLEYPLKEGPSPSETSCGLSTASFETRHSRGEKMSLLCSLLSVYEKERKKTLKSLKQNNHLLHAERNHNTCGDEKAPQVRFF